MPPRNNNGADSGVNPQLRAVYERQTAAAQARAQAQNRAASAQRRQSPPASPPRQNTPYNPQSNPQSMQNYPHQQPFQGQNTPPFQSLPYAPVASNNALNAASNNAFSAAPVSQGQAHAPAAEQANHSAVSPEIIKQLQEQARLEDEAMARGKSGGGIFPPSSGAAGTANLSGASLSEPKFSPAAGKIGEFAQNERNGYIFYGSLAQKARSPRHKGVLKEMAANCRESSNGYIELHKRLSGAAPVVSERSVDEDISFGAGVRLALEEEARALRDIVALRGETKEDAAKSALLDAALKKTADLAALQGVAAGIKA